MNISRKYLPEEIQALIMHNQRNQNVIFTGKDFEELANGTARLKVQHQADKALDEIKRRMQVPMGKGESYQTFLTRQEFGQQFGRLHDRLLFLTKTLIKKGLLTEAEITLIAHEEIAGTWLNLCDNCKNDFAICGADIEGISTEQKKFKVKFSGEIFKDLIGELADKVVECEGFEVKKVELKIVEKVEEGKNE